MSRVLDGVRRRPWVVAWLALALVTAVAVIGDDFGVFAPDTKPELYLNPDRLLDRALHAWQPDPHLGQVNYNTGVLPVAAVMTVLHATGIEPWLLQRLVMIATLLVGAWGAARLVTELTGRQGAGPWLAGVVHAWHPWTIVGAATLPVRLPHAVLPWLLLATHRAITRGGVGRTAIAGLAYGAMAGINGGIVNLLYVLPVLVLVGWEIATRQAPPLRALVRLATVGVFAIGISLYWLLPSLAAIGSSAGDVLAVTEDPVSIGRLSPPGEVLRGMGMWTSYIVLDGQIENPEQLSLLTSGPVVAAGFALLVAGIGALLAAPRRVQALAGTLVAGGLVVMIGTNSSGGISPLGRALTWLFDNASAAAAFRTTNKLGTALVLGLAIAIGAGIGTDRWHEHFRISTRTATLSIAGIVAVAAGPIIPGQLHPLQIPIPDYWFMAADATDEVAEGRLALLPGNAQTRYLWGYRGVDDLDMALFDDRHVIWRSTIPAGSAPATNALTAFDLGLQFGSNDPATLQAHSRLLGVSEALVRTDVDWIRNHGRPTGDVLADVLATPGVATVATFGPDGAERGLPNGIVPPSAPALTHVAITDTSIVQAWPVRDPLLVVGDNMAVDQMVRAGIEPGSNAMLFVDDLDDRQLRDALAAGGHVVLSDTNHRRRWEISSVTDSYTTLLPTDASAPASQQRARNPDARHQTVADNAGPDVRALDDPYSLFRLRAAGRPEFAFDGNPLTGWQYGARTSGEGGWVELRLDQAAPVQQVRVVAGTQGKAITRVSIETDGKDVTVPVIGGVAAAEIDQRTGRVRVTIEETLGPLEQPASILEVSIDGDPSSWRPVRLGARLPTTLQARAEASPDLDVDLVAADLTLLLSRLQGSPGDPFDDEEVLLRRRVTLPGPVEIDSAGVQGSVRPPTDVQAGECHVVARIESSDQGVRRAIRAQFIDATAHGEAGDVRGCGPATTLPAGEFVLTAEDPMVIDHLALSSTPPQHAPEIINVSTVSEDPSSVQLAFDQPPATPVLVSSGRAWHPDWEATADGQPMGRPLVAAGYAAGWIVPAGTQTIDITFAPQRATDIGQAASASTLALAVAAAAVGRVARRRR